MTSNNEPLPAHNAHPRSKWIIWAVAAILLVAALPALARFATTSASWLDYPYPRPGSEGLILYETLLVKHGGDIYAPITADKFISGPYPPIYYWLASLVLPNALPDFSSPASVTSIFEPGRMISLIASVIAALAIIALVAAAGFIGTSKRLLACGLIGGATGSAVFLAMPQVTVWATRFRGDMLMIALTAAGLACVALVTPSMPDSPTTPKEWAWLAGAAILFALAFYTKQTALAGPIAAALYLLLRNWRLAIRWCVLMLAAVMVPFAVLEIATAHWFYLKMVTYHSLPIRPLTLERLLQFAFWEDEWPVILLALASLAIGLISLFRNGKASDQAETQGVIEPTEAKPRPGSALLKRLNKPSSIIPYFLLAALITLPTGAVVGADHNHLLMPGLAVAAGVGALIAHLLRKVSEAGEKTQGGLLDRSTATYVAIGLTVALIAGYFLFTSEPSSWYNPDLQKPSAEQQEQLRKIIQNVHQNPGTLFFADDPGILALAGKATNYDDPFTMTALAPQNRWDESTYREQLRDGKLALLVLSCDVTIANSCRGDTFTPGVLDAIRDGYNVLFRDLLFTYAPKRP